MFAYPVAGRGVGCGRIPEQSPLIDQPVSAFYLQLERTVQNIATSIKSQGKPPFLTYRELKYDTIMPTYIIL